MIHREGREEREGKEESSTRSREFVILSAAKNLIPTRSFAALKMTTSRLFTFSILVSFPFSLPCFPCASVAAVKNSLWESPH